MRRVGGGEVPLETYARLQSDEAMPRAVLRRMEIPRVVEDHPGADNLSCGSDDKASPRRFDHWQSDLLQVVEFQDTAHLGLLTRPRRRALLRPERIIDPRQPVEGESFQH